MICMCEMKLLIIADMLVCCACIGVCCCALTPEELKAAETKEEGEGLVLFSFFSFFKSLL